MINADLFADDPRSRDIPNDGVSAVGAPTDHRQWEVLRYELESFVCRGEYQDGLQRILDSYLRHKGNPTQPAVWVSGFYGSGKSHLVRVLEHLWADTKFPDGTSARGLVKLPEDLRAALTELSTFGHQVGAPPWSVSGTFNIENTESLNLTFLAFLFAQAGLPRQVAPAQLALWLKDKGIYDAVRQAVATAGKEFDKELRSFNLSTPLAQALVIHGDLGETVSEVRSNLRSAFPEVKSIDTDTVVELTKSALMAVGSGSVPPALIVLDEVQQFVNDDGNRAMAVQHLVEAMSRQFSGRVLVVATGQQEVTATPTLQKIQDRFSVRAQLRSQDVDAVVREVVLRKKPDQVAVLDGHLGKAAGEISRELQATKIHHTPADNADLVTDFPLLPARRRFWEEVLREADFGRAGQLRSQLRIVHEANRAVAEEPAGTVVGADYLYGQKADDLNASGKLLKETMELIADQRSKVDGADRTRLLQLITLIGLLPVGTVRDTGVRATAGDLADLMVRDLLTDGARLRQQVPRLLEAMADEALLQRLGDEYRLQTRAGKEWEQDYLGRRAGLDTSDLVRERNQRLTVALSKALPTRTAHGAAKVPRSIRQDSGSDTPVPDDDVVVWIRSEWDDGGTSGQFTNLMRSLGLDSAVIGVWLPRQETEAMQASLREYLAADQVLQQRPHPVDDEGRQARQSMQSRRDTAGRRIDDLVADILTEAVVLVGGGGTVTGTALREHVLDAAAQVLPRQFPDFTKGDHATWSAVLTKVKGGATGDALSTVGHRGDSTTHPVTKTILDSVGQNTAGSELTKRFESAPYGWPVDAIRAAAAVLVADGHLTAALPGRPLSAAEVAGLATKFGTATFKAESVVLTTDQKLQARSILNRLGVTAANDDLVDKARTFLTALSDRATAVSGEAPLPTVSVPESIRDLQRVEGNALVTKLLEAKDAVEQFHSRLSGFESRRQARWEQFTLASELAQAAAELPETGPARTDLEQVAQSRALLDDVDPLEPVLQALAGALRIAVTSAAASCEQERTRVIQDLSGQPPWAALDEPTRDRLLNQRGLIERPAPDLRDAKAVRAALLSTPLAGWVDATLGLPTRADQALADAVALAGPKVASVRLPVATLTSPQDIESYLNGLRARLTTALAGHDSVTVTR